jgi:trimethylamine:corrinoid methyltransferase-like protein
MLELLLDQPLFIGFKVESALRQQLDTLRDSDKKYISGGDSTSLNIGRVGDDVYVGKVVHESLTTDRVEDIRRNILSILRKLGGAVRLPTNLKIFACRTLESTATVSVPRVGMR